jgi:hypothetical protein
VTTTAPPAQLWSTMPGWGIAADLTPPELINARAVNLLRKWLGVGLAVLLVACIGGYVVAARQHSAATSALDQVQTQTHDLQSGVGKYAGVSQLQGTTTQVQTQIATLMGSDVDLVTLLGRLHSTLPETMTISSETVTMSLAGAAAVPATGGVTTIGTVVIAGTGKALSNLAAYVDNVVAIPGVADVNPTTNVVSGRIVSFSLSLNLTSAALSHRFDVAKTGTK